MLNKIKNFFSVVVSRPIQFIYVVGLLCYVLSFLLALIISIPHILDLYSFSVLTVDASLIDSDMNLFLKFLIKLLVFFLSLGAILGVTVLFSFLVVLTYIPFYPYINFMTASDFSSREFQIGDWVFSLLFYASSFFWIAFVVLAFLAFTEYWKRLWSLIYYGEKYDDEPLVNETNYGGDWKSAGDRVTMNNSYSDGESNDDWVNENNIDLINQKPSEETFDKSNEVDMSSSENVTEERLTVENRTQALKDLKQLLDDGAISTEEFNKLKRELLD